MASWVVAACPLAASDESNLRSSADSRQKSALTGWADMARAPRDLGPKFGIGEWFGHSLVELTAPQRQQFASEVLKPKRQRQPQPCPFQSRKAGATCSKDGGVC